MNKIVNFDYMWQKQLLNPLNSKDLSMWNPCVGIIILDRDKNGFASKIKFQLLMDNSNSDIYLLCDANNWKPDDDYKLSSDSHGNYFYLDTNKLSHLDEYLFLVDGTTLKDPASRFFSNNGNSIVYDFEDPSVYRPKYDRVYSNDKSLRILQSDLRGFMYHFKDRTSGAKGKDVPLNETFKFICDSGILEYVSELGFNALQFLPVAQTIDGENWKHRYLVPYHFAIDNKYGTPSDFIRLVDLCHKNGIAIIDDVVLGHMPDRDYEIFGKLGDLHRWYDRHNNQLFMDDETTWGSRRPNFTNPMVRNYMIESCLFFMKYYNVDGFRVDNVDGILRLGPDGEGEDRPGGREFMRELARTLYTYNKDCYISYEAHYFHGDNAKMLVAPIDSDNRALAGTCYNSSRITHFLHKDFMLKMAGEISVWKIKYICDEKEWGKSNSCISDFHNHDAAAGLMYGRATGAYAYKCMILDDKENLHKYALGKIKAMECLISFFGEARTLDLMQTFLLQVGTFEHDTGINWSLVDDSGDSLRMQNLKRAVNLIMDERAFWPVNNDTRKFLNVDDKSKILVIEREDERNNQKYIIVCNLSDFEHDNYCIGVKDEGSYECILNTDDRKYAGSGSTRYYDPIQTKSTDKFELFNKELDLGRIMPYQCLVFKKL